MKQNQIRQTRKQIAKDTLEILKTGFFFSPQGKMIEIEELQEKAEKHTKVYTPRDSNELLENINFENLEEKTEITVTEETSLDAVRRLVREGHNDVICLNFASAKYPGGGFLGGSEAQEESIARSTGLYNCLLKAKEYYFVNRESKSCIYTDYMIYSPSVPIIREENGTNVEAQMSCSIITAPVVNFGVVKRREPDQIEEVEEIMKRRIKKVMAIALSNNHKTVVLGAWGCGVFQNNPNDIARYFREILSGEFKNQFERIIFAIFSKNQKFIAPFRKEFGT